MLRRRILASAMASVMAIGSVAVVASAEDTAAATKQMKTKADLEALVKSYDSFRTKEINDYGSKSGENFLDALEYAENVLDETKSTVEDYTVAYQMVTATYNALKVYTVEELSTLVKANKSKYESNNVNDELLGDTIYKNDNDQWNTFVAAYENAESLITSKESRYISDAYEELEEAVKNLTPESTVTKAQFRSALKTYEQLKQKVYTYDTWRRGSYDDGWVEMESGNFWKYKGKEMSFGALLSYLTSQETNGKTGFYDVYNELDEQKTVSKTSLAKYVEAYNTVVEANDALKNWNADDTNRASKATVKSLINKYRSRLVFDFCSDEAEDLLDAIVAAVDAAGATLEYASGDAADPWQYELSDDVEITDPTDPNLKAKTKYNKLVSASLTVWTTSEKNDGSGEKFASWEYRGFWIPVTDDGMYDNSRPVVTKKEDATTGYKFVSVGSKFDITSVIDTTGKITLVANGSAGGRAAAVKTTAGDVLRNTVDAVKAAEDMEANGGDFNDNGTVYHLDGIATQTTKAELDKVAATCEKADAWKTYSDGYVAAYKALKAALAELKTAASAAKPVTATVNAKAAAVNKAVKNMNAYNASGSKFKALQDSGNQNAWNMGKIAGMYANSAKAASNAALKLSGVIVNADRDRTVDNTLTNGILDKPGEYMVAWGFSAQPSIYLNDKAGYIDVEYVDLETAMKLAELYIEGDTAKIADDTKNDIYKLNSTGEILKGAAKMSSLEWTMVYRYLSYALADKYDVAVGKYTKADVVELLEKSYDLAEKTGDAAIFQYNHNLLVDARKEASDWVAAANKDRQYKDNVSAPNGRNSTDMYKTLNDAYTALEKDFGVFKYSFSEIYNKLAAYAEMIDENELEPNDTLKTAMEKTALKLSTVGDLDKDLKVAIDNEAFTSDRFFQGFNRVYTNTSTDNTYDIVIGADKTGKNITVTLPKAKSTSAALSHYELMEAFEALEAEVAKQTTPTTLLGDVNGDGVVNALDAAAILKAVVNNTAIDVAVGDYNADGAVNALDAAAILKFVVSKA